LKIRLLFLLVWILAACNSVGSQTDPTIPSTALPQSTTPAESETNPTQPLQPAPSASQPPTGTPLPEVEVPGTPTFTPVAQPSTVLELPEPGSYRWELMLDGLDNPVGVENAGDGSGRLFIIEQEGFIRLWQDGAMVEQLFLDIRDRVGRNGSEQGLLGLAFHPRFVDNGYFYVNYTDQGGDTHISRFSVSPDNPNLADPASEEELIFQPQPYPNHNGGAVVFGPDGYLYLGLGDGGAGGDPQGNAQSTQTWLGKILRIDVDGGEPYAIPGDNPFAGGGGLPEIWAYGLRNPWRFTFDRLTGDLYIGDVGQNQWEEIDFQPAGSPGGANFGWDHREGNHRYEGVYLGADLIDPVAEYDHSQGCSVTSGAVYRGQNLPAWQGVYLYGDYCSGLVWGLLRGPDGGWQNELLFETGARITSFGSDESGEIYLVDHTGNVYKLTQ